MNFEYLVFLKKPMFFSYDQKKKVKDSEGSNTYNHWLTDFHGFPDFRLFVYTILLIHFEMDL